VLDASADQDGRRPERYLSVIANRPVIAHVIGELADAGIEQVLVVAGQQTQAALAPLLRHGEPWQVNVQLVESDAEQSVFVRLREEATGGPVLIQAADCFFPGHLARLQESLADSRVDAAVLVRSQRSEIAAGSSTGRLLRLPRDHPQGTAMLVSPSGWPVLEGLPSTTLSVARLTESLQRAGRRVELCDTGEYWCYCDSPQRLLEGNRMLLDSMPSRALAVGAIQDSDAQGRVSVSPSARVVRSTLRGPVMIGAGAVVEDSFIGPYTAVGPKAKIVGAEVDYSMVLAGAEVRHPGHRLEGSVVGERAVVTRSFELPAGLHLRIGPGARVVMG
jgi:glucose-1-phosphate thymidylyltransferase